MNQKRNQKLKKHLKKKEILKIFKQIQHIVGVAKEKLVY